MASKELFRVGTTPRWRPSARHAQGSGSYWANNGVLVVHFTYQDPADAASLHQGDVLRRTEQLDDVLKEVHPHYHDKIDYKHFIILTQTCDLVRREDGRCNARYVTIAAVRPVRLATARYVERQQRHELERQLSFCEAKGRDRLRQFVERLLNNNEAAYFYLHREPSRGFGEGQCAFLHLSIALKTQLHYDMLLDAKCLQLKEAFQHKLGATVGRLYSRIATEDWVPTHATKSEFTQEVTSKVKDVDVIWLEKRSHRRVVEELKGLPSEEQTVDKFEELVREVHRDRKTHLADLIALVRAEAKSIGIDQERVDRLATRLRSRSELQGLLR